MKILMTILGLLFFEALSFSQTLTVPEMTSNAPKAGSRVKIVPENYRGTGVYYSLYFPENYKKDYQYPLLIEYTGNKWEPSGSTGEVKDASLGYAIAKKIGAIWAVFPYIEDGKPVTKWWGSEAETLEFALTNIRDICERYGGNPAEVFICGFSRGAIAVNYLGLYNNEIADVWLGFFSHDHYDGVNEWKGTTWGSPLAEYRRTAKERFARLKGRNCLISQNVESEGSSCPTKQYIEENQLGTMANISYNLFPVPEVIKNIPSEFVPHRHTDKWLLFDSGYAEFVYDWFQQTIKSKPGTYSVSGAIKTAGGKAVPEIAVESGRTHYAITNENGEYCIEGLVAGQRKIIVSNAETDSVLIFRDINIAGNLAGVDFVLP